MNIAKVIDHTLLKPEATLRQIQTLCEEAMQYGFASVCVNPCWVRLVANTLRGNSVKICSVVGFPLGASTIDTKIYEAEQAIAAGADEIDVVANIGFFKSIEGGTAIAFLTDINAARYVVTRPHILKVIIESAALTDDEIRYISEECADAGADFIKTSTGMHPAGGAKVEHVRLIKETVGDRARIKASGGIKTYADVLKFLEAGASRIGTSSSIAIMREAALLNQGEK